MNTPLVQSSATATPRGAAPGKARVVALVGNPNTGKTALFNALTGFKRHVANYAGVTVDIGRGPIRGTKDPLELLDLPGSYSLAAASPDEMLCVRALHGRLAGQPRPGAILAIVDASNPQRNMYLLSQLLELELPVVVALNMTDIAAARGLFIDAPRLAQRLGVPVVPLVATDHSTVRPLVRVLEEAVAPSALQGAAVTRSRCELPAALATAAGRLSGAASIPLNRAEALRAVVDRHGFAAQEYAAHGGDPALLQAVRDELAAAEPQAAVAEVQARYRWVNGLLNEVLERRLTGGQTWSDRLDRVLTHRILGAVALLALLYALFWTIYAAATPLMDAIDGVFGWVGAALAATLPAGWVQSLVVDGLVAGVGGVLVFLPQILLLFLFIAVLEDCGYLARAAFMVDRLMRPLGLSGRAFIPLLSSFACAVPAIMGTRAIADRRERFITILLAPLMSCSARLPVYVLLIGALVNPHWRTLGGWVRVDALMMLGMYLVGVAVAIPLALLLRRTVFAGPPAALLLELPTYKVPRLRTIWQRMYLAGRSFVLRAGTIILLVNLVVWALGYFPRSEATRTAVQQARGAAGWDDATYDAALAGAYLRDSYLGRIGHALEPAIRPLGWDWRIGVGVVASFPAREVIVATLGTVFNLGGEVDENAGGLRDAIRAARWHGTNQPLFTLPVALSLMVFFALCAQCSSTLVTMGQETGSWVWPVVSFVGMTTLAYGAAWATVVLARAAGL